MFRQLILVIVLFDFALGVEMTIFGGKDSTIEVYPYIEMRIGGGHDATIETFPYQVLIDSAGSTCGGSIIDQFYILTAAHCIYNCETGILEKVSPKDITVLAGISWNRLLYRVANVAQTYNPNNFSANCNGSHMAMPIDTKDIAILKLEQPLTLNNITIASVKLAQEIFSNEITALVTGWGLTSNGSFPIHLQAVDVQLDKPTNGPYLTTTFKGKGTAPGDSGGPLVVERKGSFVQIGIVSSGSAYTNYYMSVPANIDYITQVINTT